MDSRQWLEELQERLARSGLPRGYVQRFVKETSDHLEDLKEETMPLQEPIQAHLGEPRQVAEAAVEAYRRRTFLGRHPALALTVFVLSPVVSLFVLMFICLVGICAAAEYFGLYVDSSFQFGSSAKAIFASALPITCVVVPVTLLSFLYCNLARRTVLGKKWILMTSGVLSAVAALIHCHVRYADPPRGDAVTIGLGIGSLLQVFQFFVPLAIGWWFATSRKHELDAISLSPC